MRLKVVCGFFLYLFAFLPMAEAHQHQVVLVTNNSCPMNTISSLELRKVYFGIKVYRDNFQIRGLRNQSDTNLDKIFLQTVVAMSSKSYQRRLLAEVLNNGRPRIAEFSNTELLLKELRRISCHVTYMWADNARQLDDLKIIKLLWQKN
jgi:hypothetical protein